MFFQKLIAGFADILLFTKQFFVVVLYHLRASYISNGRRLIILVPDNIGDTLIQVPWLANITHKHPILILSRTPQKYLKTALAVSFVHLPNFQTRMHSRFTKILYSWISIGEPYVFVASTFRAQNLIESALRINAFLRFVYRGEKIHEDDYQQFPEDSFKIIETPNFEQNDSKLDAHIVHHINHYYKSVFQVHLSVSRIQAEFKELATLFKSVEKRIVLIPHASKSYRDINKAVWDEIVKRYPYDKIIIIGTKNKELQFDQKIEDLRGKTSIEEALAHVGSAEEVWSVENGLAHYSFLTGVKTHVFLGGGHFGRYLPWVEELENLTLIHQEDQTCFKCNWNCIFETLDHNSAPCLKNLTIN
jgi:hypothetical protein